MADPNYVVGRGKLYFHKFLAGTRTLDPATGERYLGNSPELSTNQSEEKLDHYNADAGIRVKDASVSLQNDMSGSFSLDDIQNDNLALWFRGESQVNATGAVVDGTTTVDSAMLGTFVQLGLTAGDPIGARNVSGVTAVKVGTSASGTVTFSTAVPDPDDTVTVGGVVYTFKAAVVDVNDVLIGATIDDTATNLATAINLDRENNPFFAEAAGAVTTITADATGADGNAITLAKVAATPANVTVSGATLAGGSDVGTEAVAEAGNFEVDATTGRVYLLPNAVTLAEGDELIFTYDAAAGTENIVIAQGEVIEGRLVFISDNAAGANKDYIWPCVQVSPDGDFALKGDDWQTMNFNFEVLKLNDSTERQYIVNR